MPIIIQYFLNWSNRLSIINYIVINIHCVESIWKINFLFTSLRIMNRLQISSIYRSFTLLELLLGGRSRSFFFTNNIEGIISTCINTINIILFLVLLRCMRSSNLFNTIIILCVINICNFLINFSIFNFWITLVFTKRLEFSVFNFIISSQFVHNSSL